MKRMITIVGISIGITTIGLITGTLPIISIIMMIILAIECSYIAIINLKILYETRKRYKEFVLYAKYVRSLKRKKYKAYFAYHGEELKEIIASYDMLLELYQELINIYIEYFSSIKKYLGKKRYNEVLEIAKEIREPDRA